jgi:integrase
MFKAAAVEAGLSPATVNKHLRHLSHLFGSAAPAGPGNRDGLGVISAAPWTKPLRERENEIRVVDDHELAAFYEACPAALFPVVEGVKAADWWRAWIVCAITAVIRRGALWSLKWEQVDLHNRWFIVDGDGDKSGRVRRKRIHAAALDHLLRIRRPTGRVFEWPHSESTYYRQFRRLSSLSGTDFVLHDLKRSGLTRLASTVDAFTLQKIGDHSSVKTTQRYYVGVDDARTAAAVDSLSLPAVLDGRNENGVFKNGGR